MHLEVYWLNKFNYSQVHEAIVVVTSALPRSISQGVDDVGSILKIVF